MPRRSASQTVHAKTRRGGKSGGGDYSAVLVALFLIAVIGGGTWYWWPRDVNANQLASKTRRLTARHPDAEVFSSDIEAPLTGEKKK